MRTGRAGAAVALAAALCGAGLFAQAPAQQAPPVFRAGADVVLIDAHVVARDGAPIAGLAPDQFEVYIDGRRRPVLAAEFVRAGAGAAALAPGPPAPGTLPADGRVIVLAIDQTSFPVSAEPAAREAATRVVDLAPPEDYLGFIAFPAGAEVAPTRDRAAIRAAIARIAGRRFDAPRSAFTISAAEASLLKSKDSIATKGIIARECRLDPFNPACPAEVIQDGGNIADALERQAVTSIAGLHGVIDAIGWPGRKTLVVVSAGLPMARGPGGRPNLDAETARVARRAAEVNASLYVLYLNVHFFQFFAPDYGRRNYTIYDDIAMFGYGLERFADGAGGTFYQVEVDANPIVDRMLRETSASYLLAVRAEPAERDGQPHFVRVAVPVRGATVRYRRVVTIPKAGSGISPHFAAADG